MRGRDVQDLILILLRKGLLKPIHIPSDNLFDANVEAAVKQFQRSQSLEADGVVGYRTLLLLKQ